MSSVFSSARCIARPRSAISSPTPDAASEIITCASAAEYCALMTSFLVRKASIFARSCFSFSISCSCCCSSSRDLRVEPLQLGLDRGLALERHAREVLAVLRERLARLRVELDHLLLELLRLHLDALLRGDDVGDALLDLLKMLLLLAVAVVERLGRVLGAVEHLRDLRLDRGGHPAGQAWHRQASLGSGQGAPRLAARVQPKPPSASQSVLTRWMGIQDANIAGNVHGGTIMKMVRRGRRRRRGPALRAGASSRPRWTA